MAQRRTTRHDARARRRSPISSAWAIRPRFPTPDRTRTRSSSTAATSTGCSTALQIERDVTLVVHDWGSALGFDWANRHPDAVAGIAYMEAIVQPLRWDDWPSAARGIFQGFRSPAGETMVLDKNLFVEAVLPASVIRSLSDAEMAEYRRPYTTPGESRRPTLTWPRQIPIDGEPPDVVDIVADYAQWLTTCDVPKLLVVAEPGAILRGRQLEFCRALAQPVRDHRARQPLPARGQPRRDR